MTRQKNPPSYFFLLPALLSAEICLICTDSNTRNVYNEYIITFHDCQKLIVILCETQLLETRVCKFSTSYTIRIMLALNKNLHQNLGGHIQSLPLKQRRKCGQKVNANIFDHDNPEYVSINCTNEASL